MLFLRYLLLSIAFSSAFAFSQENAEIESAIVTFEKSTDRKEKFELALSIAADLNSFMEYDRASEYVIKASELVDEEDNQERVQLLHSEGISLLVQNELELAEQKILTALELARELDKEDLLIESYAILGSVYTQQSKVFLSNSYWFSCIPYYQKTDDLESLQNAYNNVGFNYTIYYEHQLALEYYLKAYEIGEQIGDIDAMSAALINIGYTHEVLGDKEKALEDYRRSLYLHEELGIEEYVGYSYVLMGTMFAEMNELDSASYYLDFSNEILDRKGDEYGLSYVHYGYSVLSEKKGAFQKSEEHAEQSLNHARNANFIENEMKSLNQLRLIYYRQGKYKQAYDSYEKYVLILDSIKNPLNSREIAGLEYKHEYQTLHISDSLKFEEEQKISSLKHEEELKRYWIYAITGIVFVSLLVILLAVLIRSSKIRKRKNQELQEKNVEIQHQKENIEIARDELEVKNNEILDSIKYAKRIQSAILPPTKIVKEYLQNSFILYKPKDIVAGDFYWLEHKNESILFAAADCTGHGVPGAMVSVICNNGLNRSVRELGLTDPGKILDNTRDIVIKEFEKSEEEVQDGMDIALCALKGNELSFAGAHNPLWIIRNGATEIEELKANKQPIGKFRHSEAFSSQTVTLEKGDSIYIFTDGFADQFGGEKGKKYKTSNFKRLLLSIQDKSMEQQKELLDRAFEEWKGGLEQLDDVCVIGVRV